MIEPPQHPDFRLLARRVDWIAKCDPSRTYARYPKCPDDISAGFENVTFRDIAVAINRAAWWLSTRLEDDDETFAYWGPSDLRWSILLVAGIKCGKTVCEPLRSRPGSGCSVIVCDDKKSNDAMVACPLRHVSRGRPLLRKLAVPSLSEFLSTDQAAPPRFVYAKTWKEAASEMVVGFLSSETTGTPKLTLWSNRRVASWSSILALARQDASVLIPDVIGKTVFNAFMPFHVAGYFAQLLMPVYFGSTVVLRHPLQVMDSNTIRQVMTSTSCNSILAPPGLLTTLTRCSRTLAVLRFLESIVVATTGLNEDCCELLPCPGLSVQRIYVHVETFPVVQKHELARDPRYMKFHRVSGAIFLPHSSGHSELTFLRREKAVEYQNCFDTLPLTEKFSTGALFSGHPSLSDLWMFEGHADNRIHLMHGEEVDVWEMEQAVSTHALVKSALIYGESRCRPLLVIEPWSDAMKSLKSGSYSDYFLDEVWPAVEEANTMSSGPGRLCRELTFIATAPLARTPRHMVDRHNTAVMMKDQVNRLFDAYTGSVQGSTLPPLKPAPSIIQMSDKREIIPPDLSVLQLLRAIHA